MKLNSRIFVLIIVIVLLIPSYVFSAGNVPVYKFGIDAACPPWTWVEKGEVLGFDREVIDFICQEEGFEVEWIDIPWSTIISATSKGKIDILGGGLSFTFERAKIIDYARVHFKIGTHALARKDSTLTDENSFVHGPIDNLIIWGMMMYNNIFQLFKPIALAASICPGSTDRMAPLNI